MMSGEMFPIPLQDRHQPPPHEPNPNSKPISNLKKKRNLPGTPDPDAEVMALSPKSLMATNRFVCEICNKGFQRDQNLQLHRRGHNLPWKLKQRNPKEPIKKKVYICPEKTCVHHDPSRALGDLTGIKKHYSRKHGEKKWKCEKCSKKYAVQSDWKAHSKTCGTREYKCDCGTLFSRKDSFITHRAFCDALAEESVRLSSVTPNVLGLKNEGMNESMMNPNFPHGFSGITQYGSGFRTDFGDQNKPRLSLWLDQANSQLNLSPMDQMSMNSNLYMSSSSTGLADMVNAYGSSSMANFTNSNQVPNLSLTALPEDLKEETLASLYSMNHPHQSESTGPMSATALLQKAAQMGSTRSNPSMFGTSFGLMNSSSTTSNTAVSLVKNNITQLQAVSTAMNNNNSSSSSPRVSNLDQQQLMIMSRNETMAPLKMMNRSFSGVDNGLTRDFLGVGGEGGRPLLPQDLVNFASYGSTMGSMRQFASNN
ncbi:putative transcription factor C2H2 family [Helianthus annuus]|uniref:Putative C2H2-like zinc finger protein n=1 Tax=Helianthus annuus TaxID=4232 RepID=A0A251SL75_HELAN|nr:zinc finger protein JACKDAW isoform X1 [Helianthus annuus]XP_022006021.1 zinc finger protein JACKDAW isoform X1 [Helianthus annuus]XP_035839281.1 zinc finger protein JACKDAW isoform X1 [Helianthus annuus]KAF5770356.1 putative transcription factor C2H2 family [Helianthus annuus]KAJ0465280.1 putative transcription factor C2H2 family [Helianthus annuus]KAJ0486872.1 putative transcription factor C2H2 family [Helianthus annuus]KAJ0661005.1 putative transcription factor C2H2 family [Helianthus a